VDTAKISPSHCREQGCPDCNDAESAAGYIEALLRQHHSAHDQGRRS
jgi:hypothetical protein